MSSLVKNDFTINYHRFNGIEHLDSSGTSQPSCHNQQHDAMCMFQSKICLHRADLETLNPRPGTMQLAEFNFCWSSSLSPMSTVSLKEDCSAKPIRYNFDGVWADSMCFLGCLRSRPEQQTLSEDKACAPEVWPFLVLPSKDPGLPAVKVSQSGSLARE